MATSGTARTQARGELLAQLAFGLDDDALVDRLVGHPPLWLVRVLLAQAGRDLLERPLLGAEQLVDLVAQPGALLGPGGLGPQRLASGTRLGFSGPVTPSPTVGRDLPPDARAGPAEPLGDDGVGLVRLDADPDLLTLGYGERSLLPLSFLWHHDTPVAQAPPRVDTPIIAFAAAST